MSLRARWSLTVITVLAACSEPVSNDDDGTEDEPRTVEIVHPPGSFDGDLVGGRITARGTIEPWTYTNYGLRARGYHTQLVTPTTTSADLADALVGPPEGTRYRFMPGSFGDAWPRGLGLGRADDFTIIVDGELELPAGDVVLELSADDIGFIELDVDGLVTTLRSVDGVSSAVTIEVPEAGWYPIVGAMSDASGTARYELRRDGADVAAAALHFVPIDAQGLEVFAAPMAALDRGVTTVVTDLPAGPLGRGPSDLDLEPPYFASYQGYILIEEAGSYGFDLDLGTGPDFAYMIEIDGGYLAAMHGWPGNPDVASTVEITPGWHWITMDLAGIVPESRFSLVVTAAGEPIPILPSSLRPIARKSERGHIGNDRATWANGGQLSYPMALRSPVVTSDSSPWELELSASIDGALDATMTLTTPDGELIDLGSQTTATLPPRLSLAGTWTLTIDDAGTDGQGGQVIAGITATHPTAVEDLPLTSTMIYTSPPIPTPGANRLIALYTAGSGWVDSPQIRSRYTLDALEDAPWQGPSEASLSEWTQYRITVSPRSDAPFCDISSVTLKYERTAEPQSDERP